MPNPDDQTTVSLSRVDWSRAKEAMHWYAQRLRRRHENDPANPAREKDAGRAEEFLRIGETFAGAADQ